MDFQNWIRSYVIQVIPLISLILYVMGFCYYIAYYAVFGINIISYITLSEVLVAAFIPISLCVILGLFYVILYGISFHAIVKSINKDRRLKSFSKKLKNILAKKRENIPFSKQLKVKLYSILIFMIGIIMLILFLDCDIYSKRIILIGCGILLILSTYDDIRFYNKIRFKRIRQTCCGLTFSIVGTGLVFVLVVLGIIEGKSIQIEKPQYFEATLTDGSRLSSQEYVFIGETATAVFIYERETNISIILNKDNVVSVAMKPEYTPDQLLFEGPRPFKYNLQNLFK